MDAVEEFATYKAFNTNPNYILNDQTKFQSNALYDIAMRVHV